MIPSTIIMTWVLYIYIYIYIYTYIELWNIADSPFIKFCHGSLFSWDSIKSTIFSRFGQDKYLIVFTYHHNLALARLRLFALESCHMGVMASQITGNSTLLRKLVIRAWPCEDVWLIFQVRVVQTILCVPLTCLVHSGHTLAHVFFNSLTPCRFE